MLAATVSTRCGREERFEPDERSRDRENFRASTAASRGRVAAPFIAPALAVLCVINVLPFLWSIGVSFFHFRADHLNTPPRFLGFGNYARSDHRSGHLGALRQHRRDDRLQRFDPTRRRRAVGLSVSSAISGPSSGDDAGLDADAALDGGCRHVFQPVLRSDVRHRERDRAAVHRCGFRSVGNAVSRR